MKGLKVRKFAAQIIKDLQSDKLADTKQTI